MRVATRAAVLATIATMAGGGIVVTSGTAGATPAPKLSLSATGAGPNVVKNSKYQAVYTTPTTIETASVSFTVPQVTCGSDTQGTAFGVGNEQSPGVPTVIASVFVACVGGTPYYQAATQAGTDLESGAAAAGDAVTVLITQTADTETATVTNLTQQTTTTSTGTPTPDDAIAYGAFPLYAGSTTALDVAPFVKTMFGMPALNGAKLQSYNPTLLNRKSNTTVQISTSHWAPNGNFALIFRSSTF